MSAFALSGKGDHGVGRGGMGVRVLGLSLEPEWGQFVGLELKGSPVSRRRD